MCVLIEKVQENGLVSQKNNTNVRKEMCFLHCVLFRIKSCRCKNASADKSYLFIFFKFYQVQNMHDNNFFLNLKCYLILNYFSREFFIIIF
jgi:hypothetical protein